MYKDIVFDNIQDILPISKFLLTGLSMGLSPALGQKDVTPEVPPSGALGLLKRMGHAMPRIWQQAKEAHSPGPNHRLVVRVFSYMAGDRRTPAKP